MEILNTTARLRPLHISIWFASAAIESHSQNSNRHSILSDDERELVNILAKARGCLSTLNYL
jgi:hypothetical protein